MVSTMANKQDNYMREPQDNLGKGIALLGSAISRALDKPRNPDEPDENLSDLVETGKMFCYVHN